MLCLKLKHTLVSSDWSCIHFSLSRFAMELKPINQFFDKWNLNSPLKLEQSNKSLHLLTDILWCLISLLGLKTRHIPPKRKKIYPLMNTKVLHMCKIYRKRTWNNQQWECLVRGKNKGKFFMNELYTFTSLLDAPSVKNFPPLLPLYQTHPIKKKLHDKLFKMLHYIQDNYIVLFTLSFIRGRYSVSY